MKIVIFILICLGSDLHGHFTDSEPSVIDINKVNKNALLEYLTTVDKWRCEVDDTSFYFRKLKGDSISLRILSKHHEASIKNTLSPWDTYEIEPRLFVKVENPTFKNDINPTKIVLLLEKMAALEINYEVSNKVQVVEETKKPVVSLQFIDLKFEGYKFANRAVIELVNIVGNPNSEVVVESAK